MLRCAFFALAAVAEAVNLFVADYNGNITTLSLSNFHGNYSLVETHRTQACAPSPAWLTIDPAHGVLYCLNEGLNRPNGSLNSFIINSNGSLDHVQNTTTAAGPVGGVIYGEPAGQRAIALAHDSGSAVSSWLLEDQGSFTFNQYIFTLRQPGAVSSRQATPPEQEHEHEAITDPTGQYVVVPDLGADLVRVFSWDHSTLKLSPQTPLQAASGSGPRHAVFHTPSGIAGSTTYLYLLAELAATVTAYEVSYLPNNAGLSFTELSSQAATWLHALPQRNFPAEILVSPDNRFLVISNRNDTSFNLPLPNGTTFPSDSLSTWALADDGSLTFHQLWPAGGSFPRHFSMNAIGNLVAVGLEDTQEVSILSRDVQSGLIGESVARIHIAGSISNVVWDEDRALGVLGG